jgi:hypothetical protein
MIRVQMVRVQNIRVQTILKALAGVSALLIILATLGQSQRALAQTDHPVRTLSSSSAPLLAAGGEKLLFCAANNLPAVQTSPTSASATSTTPSTTLTVTLQILNGVTGAVVAQNQVALPPLGTFEPPDPCIAFTVAPAAFAPSTSLFVARILLNPQPLPPGRCRADSLTASLQAFTSDATGNPTDIRTLVFTPPDPCTRPFFFRRGPSPTAVNP